jgi:hypothetical protein
MHSNRRDDGGNAGVRPEILRAILKDDVTAMPDDVALAWRFTKATLARDLTAADDYRAVILERWGPRAVVSLAFAITAARIYPTVKYALGHGKACTRVVVGGMPLMFDQGRVPALVQPKLRSSEVGPVDATVRMA